MTNTINFPPEYKKALLNKTKHTTLRFKDEINKYKVGEIYTAVTYKTQKPIGVKIKILSITPVNIKTLASFYPERNYKSFLKKVEKEMGSINLEEKVEMIKFQVL